MFVETPTPAGERDRKPGPILAYSHNDEMQNTPLVSLHQAARDTIRR